MTSPYYAEKGIEIYHGDSREIVPDLAAVDMIMTDPPYGHNNNNGDLIHVWEQALGRRKTTPEDARPIANDGPEANELARWLFKESRRLLKPGCCCCCCCCGGGGPDPQFARWSLTLDEELGFKHAVVWDKGGLGMGWHYRRNYEFVLVGMKPGAACKWNGGLTTPNVVRIRGIIPDRLDHPTPKPVSLMRFFIHLHSDLDDLVLDPFMGCGTTLIAAKSIGRRAIGIELEEKYCEMAAKKLAQGVLPFSSRTVPVLQQTDLYSDQSSREG